MVSILPCLLVRKCILHALHLEFSERKMETPTIYRIERGALKERKLEGCRVDGHVHSCYSGREPVRYVGTPLTKLMGVKESYTTPKKIHSVMKKRGMRFCTISDHDSVTGSLEMRRRYPEDSFVSCEYTVRVSPEMDGQAIHVGVWGLDYPGDTSQALPDSEVLVLHQELLGYAQEGYVRFVEFCEKRGLGFCLNHPGWQGSPKNPLTGSMLDDITDAFPILEVNGECQFENLLAIEIAVAKNKTLCAGTDAHSPVRVGKQYTATLYPVDTMKEFLQAFRKGDIGIGSSYGIPDHVENPSLCDVVRYRFNGTVANLRRETYQGVYDYFLSSQERSVRKVVTMTLLLGLPVLFSTHLGAEITLPALFAMEGLALASLTHVMPRIEKTNSARETRRLYKGYQRHLASRETEAIRAEISQLQEKLKRLNQSYEKKELPELMVAPRLWDRILLKLLGGLKPLHSDYDLGETSDQVSLMKSQSQ